MDEKRKFDGESARKELRETRRTLVSLIQLCADDRGEAEKVDVYREARRRGILPTGTEEALQLLLKSNAIMETSDGRLLLTYQ